MYIKDINKLKHTYICSYCSTMYKTNKTLKEHEENCPCKKALTLNKPSHKLKFQGGNFKKLISVPNQVINFGIDKMNKEHNNIEPKVIYDKEAFLKHFNFTNDDLYYKFF